jgi:hypothetical protein
MQTKGHEKGDHFPTELLLGKGDKCIDFQTFKTIRINANRFFFAV